jgi:hypothetical protein
MTRLQIENLKAVVAEEVERRERLGGYSQEAGAILLLFKLVANLAQHALDEMPPNKKKN